MSDLFGVVFPGGGLDFARPLDPLLIAGEAGELLRNLDCDLKFVDMIRSGQLVPPLFGQVVTSAIYLGAFRKFREAHSDAAIVVTGHSAGMWSACAAAQAISNDQSLQAMCLRAELLSALPPMERGRMIMLVGPSPAEIDELVSQFEGVWVASYNGQRSVTISMTCEAERLFEAEVQRTGFAEIRSLPIAFASHCPLMGPLAAPLAAHVETLTFEVPSLPLFDSSVAVALSTGSSCRESLAQNILRPVRWGDTIRAISTQFGEVCFVDLLGLPGVKSILGEAGIRKVFINAA
jgi:[acyl-carrier-protein] S-malonyltransferase